MEYRQKIIAYLPVSCYNIGRANRILEYPGRRQAGRKPYRIGVGRFYFEIESFHVFLFAEKQPTVA